MRDHSKVARGRWGEELAARHLERIGLRIVGRNWRSPEPHERGDLDLIAVDDDLVVFCEVKARRRGGFGGAVAAVDERKQHQIRRLATTWMRLYGDAYARARFDVVGIDGVRVTHIDSAF